MNVQKVSFKNNEGQNLSGRLELPLNQKAHNYVLFAHCFTCNKNLLAIKNISRSLTAVGFGVLRFDFTGLGESDGDFEDTNFSGNVEDLIAACEFLSDNYLSPSLIIGHSLGGAAAIFAAAKIDSVQAVATIGAPSNPNHVTNLLHEGLEEIEKNGLATLNLSGRNFTIKKQFIDDLQANSLPEVVKDLGKAILVLHSPQDMTVEIHNAEEIYHAARHPKSFVSLDGADHLLSRKEDSVYTGKVIASWASRYISIPKVETLRSRDNVVASLDGDEGFTTQMKVGNHHLIADEPESFGGNDFGPNPYEYVSAGLSACTVMTIQMYARRKGWHIDNVEVHTSYGKEYATDVNNCEQDDSKIDTFTRKIKLRSSLDDKQIQRIMQIADKCPVHKTLVSTTQILTELIS